MSVIHYPISPCIKKEIFSLLLYLEDVFHLKTCVCVLVKVFILMAFDGRMVVL